MQGFSPANRLSIYATTHYRHTEHQGLSQRCNSAANTVSLGVSTSCKSKSMVTTSKIETISSEQTEFAVEFLASLDQIPAAQWNDIADVDYPFLRHEFLHGLEKTGCTTAETGW